MTKETPKKIEKKVIAFVNDVEIILEELFLRWQSEWKYEDIKKYATPLARELPKGWISLGMSKEPFGFNFRIGVREFMVYISEGEHYWCRTK